MTMCWISEVPSKTVKLVEVRAVSAGSWPVGWTRPATDKLDMEGDGSLVSRYFALGATPVDRERQSNVFATTFGAVASRRTY
jgi:hypothetical protein